MSTEREGSEPTPFQRPDTAQRLELPYGPTVVRVLQDNPGPFTGPGTNTYVVGDDVVWIVDPGEDHDAHRASILDVVAGRAILGIVVTHSHRDHWPLGARLARELSVPLMAFADAPVEGADQRFAPNRLLEDDDVLHNHGASLHCVHTPGHCADHLSFGLGTGDARLPEQPVVLCGDHVMSWATTILAPPDGSLNQYLASLDRLLQLDPCLLLPAHGPMIEQPRERIESLRDHRLERTRQLLAALARHGPATLAELVPVVYADTDPAMHGAAAFSLAAHVDALIEDGRLRREGEMLELAKT